MFLFWSLLQEKKKELGDAATKLKNGLEKIDETRTKVIFSSLSVLRACYLYFWKLFEINFWKLNVVEFIFVLIFQDFVSFYIKISTIIFLVKSYVTIGQGRSLGFISSQICLDKCLNSLTVLLVEFEIVFLWLVSKAGFVKMFILQGKEISSNHHSLVVYIFWGILNLFLNNFF